MRVAPAPLYNSYKDVWMFVNILQDEISASKVIKDKIIKSLMQFAYDDLSLKVLQHAGKAFLKKMFLTVFP